MVNRTGTISAFIKPTLEISYNLCLVQRKFLSCFVGSDDWGEDNGFSTRRGTSASHASEENRYRFRELKTVEPCPWMRDFIAKTTEKFWLSVICFLLSLNFSFIEHLKIWDLTEYQQWENQKWDIYKCLTEASLSFTELILFSYICAIFFICKSFLFCFVLMFCL